ncbi:MAG: oxidoreductase [Micrococcaceae bacterium]
MMSNNLNIAIVGPGAIGTTVAAALYEVDKTPRLYGRTPREQLVLHVQDETIIVSGPVQTNPKQVKEKADLVFFAVKTTQIEGAAPWLKALCGPNTVVCVLQNGIEQVAMVSPHAAESKVIPAVVWFPVQPQPDGSAWLRGKPNFILPSGKSAKFVAEVLKDTRCSVELSDDFKTEAWRKLLLNAVDGLMALTGRRAGMYRCSDIENLVQDYLKECLAVARADGATLTDAVIKELIDKFQGYPEDMGSSILTDYEANRPMEWDIRNGVIKRLGEKYDIPTPISDVVVPLLAAASDAPG